MEETGREGDEQVWVKPGGGALLGGRRQPHGSREASARHRAVGGGAGVTTFHASLSVNACQTGGESSGK